MSGTSHHLRHHEEILLENGLILLSTLGDGGAHVVWHCFESKFETAEIEWIRSELLALRAFVVDAGEEDPIGIFVSIVLLIILGDACFSVVAEYVFGYLCEIGLEIIHEVFQLMSPFFEMEL